MYGDLLRESQRHSQNISVLAEPTTPLVLAGAATHWSNGGQQHAQSHLTISKPAVLMSS